MKSLAEAKAELRQTFRHLLSAASNTQSTAHSNIQSNGARAISELNDHLVRYLLTEPSGSSSPIWAAFQPSGFEADIRPAIQQCATRITWVFPRVCGDEIRFFRPHAHTSFTLSKWGILEPEPSQSTPVSLGELHGLLIPALAFDLNCNRLGRGGGYYDRALSEINHVNPHALKTGVALDVQISNDVFPTESFDIPMDRVITESRSFARQSGVRPEVTNEGPTAVSSGERKSS